MDKLGYPKLADFDEMYNRSSSPVNISCTIPFTSDYPQEMAKTLFGNVKSLTFEMHASCAFGCTKGNYHLGTICPKCGTEVTSIFKQELDHKGWITIPQHLPKLIHPQLFNILSRELHVPKEMKRYRNRKKLTMMDWLLDPTLPIVEFFPVLGNGYSYFNKHYRFVFEFLFSLPENAKNQDLWDLLIRYEHCLFINKIPVANEYLHLITQQSESSSKHQADACLSKIFKVYSSLVSLVKEQDLGKMLSEKNIDRRMFKIQQQYQEYPDALIYKKIISKTGLIRKNCISGRVHFTARAVIVPITDSNYGDEVYIPWEIAVVSLKSVIMNHLINRYGYSPFEASKIHSAAIKDVNHTLVDSILTVIIEECQQNGYKGWPLIINRNPSVRHGASQLAFMTKVVKHRCICISTLLINAPNADFDLPISRGFYIIEDFFLIFL